MLQQLIVHHYALVDFLHLDFSNKMTAISGETGAGKSILLGALGPSAGRQSRVWLCQTRCRTGRYPCCFLT